MNYVPTMGVGVCQTYVHSCFILILNPKSVIRPQCPNFYSYIIASCRLMSFCRRLFFRSQNGIKTVRHKYIIRLSSNDRFGLTGQTPSTLTAAWSPLRCNKPHFALQNGAYCNAKGHVLHRKTWPFANLLIINLLSVADRQRNGSACPSVRFPCVYSRLHRPHGAGRHAEDALCVVVGHLHIPQYKVEDVG